MTRKRWILTTIIIAGIHWLAVYALMPVSTDVIWSRFDGNPYQSALDPVWIGLFLLLNFPYYLLSNFLAPIKFIPGIFYLIWVGNSLAWGLLGAWLVSLLPFMRNKKTPAENNIAEFDNGS